MWTAVWWAWLFPSPVSRQALPYAEAAGCWLAGPDHHVAGCKPSGGGPGASAGSLLGRTGF